MSRSMFDRPVGLYCLAMFSDAIRMFLSLVVVGGMSVRCGLSVQVTGLPVGVFTFLSMLWGLAWVGVLVVLCMVLVCYAVGSCV